MHHKSLPLQPRTLSDQSDKQPSHCQESRAAASSQSTSIVYRGLTYTALTLSEQAVLKPQLLRACHSPNRLAFERYPVIATATNRSIPPRNHSRPKSSAVVLDCEMVGTTQGEHVVSLSLIDFFTGSTLVHALVKPAPGIFITNWRTSITGITPTVMAMAVAQGKALRGRDAAVARLLDFVDDETVLVGHSVNHDLKVLGLVHSRIVDSAILTAEASGMFGGEEYGEQQKKIRQSVGLERLCRELTGVRIRGGDATGKGSQSHDSLEDVLATREVVIWCLRHPDALRAWALKNWEGKVNNKKAQGGGNARNRNRNRRRLYGYEYVWDDDNDDDDGEMLRWEDVVDYDTWPKSPDWSD
ncbi:ribonuclease H-like domain-containing protein [Corynascus similis CBS 632.67]